MACVDQYFHRDRSDWILPLPDSFTPFRCTMAQSGDHLLDV